MIKIRNFSVNEDFSTIYDLYSDSEKQALISSRVVVKSKEQFREWLIFQLNNYYHEFRIIELNDESVGFCYSYDCHDDTVKTALYINDNFQNIGIGAAAELLFIDELFSLYPLRKIYNHVYEYNNQSLSSHFNAGFQTEGILKEYRYYKGKYHNLYILSISKEEFYNLHTKLLKQIIGGSL